MEAVEYGHTSVPSHTPSHLRLRKVTILTSNENSSAKRLKYPMGPDSRVLHSSPFLTLAEAEGLAGCKQGFFLR